MFWKRQRHGQFLQNIGLPKAAKTTQVGMIIYNTMNLYSQEDILWLSTLGVLMWVRKKHNLKTSFWITASCTWRTFRLDLQNVYRSKSLKEIRYKQSLIYDMRLGPNQMYRNSKRTRKSQILVGNDGQWQCAIPLELMRHARCDRKFGSALCMTVWEHLSHSSNLILSRNDMDRLKVPVKKEIVNRQHRILYHPCLK